MHKRNNHCNDQLNTLKREVIIGVVSSLITTAIFKFFPQIAISLYGIILNLIDSVFHSYSNSLFKTISFGEKIYPIYSICLLILYGLFAFSFFFPEEIKVEKKSRCKTSICIIILIFFCFFTQLRCTYTNNFITCMNQDLIIASCYVSDDESRKLYAKFYSVESKEDYVNLLNKLEKISNENNAKFYTPFS